MSLEKEYPILEFDPTREAIIEPENAIPYAGLPERCVICFFRDAIESLQKEKKLTQIYSLHTETIDLPVFKLIVNDVPICMSPAYACAPGAAVQLEELIAAGCRKFIVCGGAGILQKEITLGHLVLPYAAVRDEGISYHYIEPSREISCDEETLLYMEQQLKTRNIPFVKGKTWTSDGIYRETRDKIALRISEGCVVCEMETAAYFAVARFRDVRLGQILYGGDDVSGIEWDHRDWDKQESVRKNLLELSLDICSGL